MKSQATGTFAIKSWDEKPHDTLSGDIKLTRATVVQSFTGDIEGDGKVEYLMVYREDGTASFIGLQLVNGRLGDRYGSNVGTKCRGEPIFYDVSRQAHAQAG